MHYGVRNYLVSTSGRMPHQAGSHLMGVFVRVVLSAWFTCSHGVMLRHQGGPIAALWRWILVGVLVWQCAAPAQAQELPKPLAKAYALSADDLHQGIVEMQEELKQSVASGDKERQFWSHLGLVALYWPLEDDERAREQADAALRLTQAPPLNNPSHRLWVEGYHLSMLGSDHTAETLQRVKNYQQAVRLAADPALRCIGSVMLAEVWISRNMTVEGLSELQTVLKCSPVLRSLAIESDAHYRMAIFLGWAQGADAEIAELERGLAMLAGHKARYQNTVLLYGLVRAEIESGQWEKAEPHAQEMLAISRSLKDIAGVSLALSYMAQIRFKQGQFEAAAKWASEAIQAAAAPQFLHRQPLARATLVRALTRLRSPRLAGELTALRAGPAPSQRNHQLLVAQALAEGESALGHSAQAYTDLSRYVDLRNEIETTSRATQARTLLAFHAAQAREAENRQLKHQAQLAQSELASRGERQRLLWVAVVALGLLLMGALGYGWRVLQSKRQLADLALRDELTGQPNRRAIVSYAQQQLALAKRLNLPFALAMIDLDFFKRVNDTYGHGGGDEVLKAFAASVSGALRGQDKLGRFGGEEWLLVLPGTRVHELPKVFERMRDAYERRAIVGLPKPHGLSFSMGAAVMSQPAQTVFTLIEAADQAVYAAKEGGRNQLKIEPPLQSVL